MMTKKTLSRREFLQIGGLALTGLAFSPVFPYRSDQDHGLLARVASTEIDLRSLPSDQATIIGKRYRDQLVHIYGELIPPDAPQFYNRLWYRVWGGYLHSAHLQKVHIQLNEPAEEISAGGQLCEITVPYTVAYQKTSKGEWVLWRGSRLYYESTHWATGVEPGPDGEPWYQITSELSKTEVYYAPGKHLRILPPDEFAPLATDVPMEKKRIEVDLNAQTLRAYENSKVVLQTRISSGIPNSRLGPNDLPTATPKGDFRVYSKMPSKHMGSIAGGPEVEENGGFSLPGVPWTHFFRDPGGYALHGTYWHNNFGLQMSHGCVNMRNEDALWMFRWSTPAFNPVVESPDGWEQTGYGTVVKVF